MKKLNKHSQESKDLMVDFVKSKYWQFFEELLETRLKVIMSQAINDTSENLKFWQGGAAEIRNLKGYIVSKSNLNNKSQDKTS